MRFYYLFLFVSVIAINSFGMCNLTQPCYTISGKVYRVGSSSTSITPVLTNTNVDIYTHSRTPDSIHYISNCLDHPKDNEGKEIFNCNFNNFGVHTNAQGNFSLSYQTNGSVIYLIIPHFFESTGRYYYIPKTSLPFVSVVDSKSGSLSKQLGVQLNSNINIPDPIRCGCFLAGTIIDQDSNIISGVTVSTSKYSISMDPTPAYLFQLHTGNPYRDTVSVRYFHYGILVDSGWTGTVTLSKPGYTFRKASYPSYSKDSLNSVIFYSYGIGRNTRCDFIGTPTTSIKIVALKPVRVFDKSEDYFTLRGSAVKKKVYNKVLISKKNMERYLK